MRCLHQLGSLLLCLLACETGHSQILFKRILKRCCVQCSYELCMQKLRSQAKFCLGNPMSKKEMLLYSSRWILGARADYFEPTSCELGLPVLATPLLLNFSELFSSSPVRAFLWFLLPCPSAICPGCTFTLLGQMGSFYPQMYLCHGFWFQELYWWFNF